MLLQAREIPQLSRPVGYPVCDLCVPIPVSRYGTEASYPTSLGP